MFAELHGHRGGGRVDVIGRGDNDGIEALAHVFDELAVIAVLLGLRIFLAAFGECVFVHVAEGHDVAASLGGFVGVTRAFATGADDGDVEFAVEVLSAQQGGTGHRGEAGGQQRALKEAAAVEGRGGGREGDEWCFGHA